MICQTIPSKLVLTIKNLLVDPLIRLIFFTKCLKRVNSPNFSPAKLSYYTVVKVTGPVSYKVRSAKDSRIFQRHQDHLRKGCIVTEQSSQAELSTLDDCVFRQQWQMTILTLVHLTMHKSGSQIKSARKPLDRLTP